MSWRPFPFCHRTSFAPRRRRCSRVPTSPVLAAIPHRCLPYRASAATPLYHLGHRPKRSRLQSGSTTLFAPRLCASEHLYVRLALPILSYWTHDTFPLPQIQHAHALSRPRYSATSTSSIALPGDILDDGPRFIGNCGSDAIGPWTDQASRPTLAPLALAPSPSPDPDVRCSTWPHPSLSASSSFSPPVSALTHPYHQQLLRYSLHSVKL